MSTDRIRWRIVAVSFLPLTWKAVDYALLGGFVPLIALAFFVGLVALGYRAGSKGASRAIAIWSWALILWGVARLGLIGMFTWGPVREAHVQGQFTIGYVLISLGSIAFGVVLLRSRVAPAIVRVG